MMQDKIINFAKHEDVIRAVILNGSRANPMATQDTYQDYDIIYIVDDLLPFVHNQSWIDYFGQLIIMQKPDEMDGIWPNQDKKFTFLMLFNDNNLIDLTFIKKDYYLSKKIDSLSKVLLDKDNQFNFIKEATEADYLPTPPSKKDFHNLCNEFLWCSQNVVKGLCRREFTYTKHMSENILKDEIIKLLSWYVGIKTNYTKNLGSYGKNLEQYIEPELWKKFINTYTGQSYEQMWVALFDMFEIFNTLAIKISNHFHYEYDKEEYQRVLEFLKRQQPC